jgi:hypothetical protein
MSRPFKLKAPRALEYQEQAALFQWASVEARRDPRLLLLNASQNGLRASSIHTAKRAKDCGMKKGFPDLFLPVASGGRYGLFVELKRVGGTPCEVSPEQSWWLEQLSEQGYRAVVAYGWQDAAEQIEKYLNKKPALGGLHAPGSAG